MQAIKEMCDNDEMRQRIRKLQQEYQQEKEKNNEQSFIKCQKEKQQASQQLMHKFTLDLSEVKESAMKQYRLERELYENQLQLKSHKEKEEMKKELTLKYTQEMESLRLELNVIKEREIKEMKEELMKNYYHYQSQLPSTALTSSSLTDVNNEGNLQNSETPSSSPSVTFQEWKMKLLAEELSTLNNSLRSEYMTQIQQLQRQLQIHGLHQGQEIVSHTNIWLEGNALLIGAVAAVIFFFLTLKWRQWRRPTSSDSSSAEGDNEEEVANERGIGVARTISDEATTNQVYRHLDTQSNSSSTSSFNVIESATPQSLTPIKCGLSPLENHYDVFISYCHLEPLATQDKIQQLASTLQNQFGLSVYLSNSQSKERIIDALDRSKTVLICLTQAYHSRTSPAADEADCSRIELNYALGALTAAKVIVVVFDESLSKKTHWKHRFRSELYSVKPIPLFLDTGDEFEGRIKEIAERVKVTMK